MFAGTGWHCAVAALYVNWALCVQVLQGHTGYVNCVVELGDGRVVSGSADKSLRVWDVGTGQCVQVLRGHTDGVWYVMQLG